MTPKRDGAPPNLHGLDDGDDAGGPEAAEGGEHGDGQIVVGGGPRGGGGDHRAGAVHLRVGGAFGWLRPLPPNISSAPSSLAQPSLQTHPERPEHRAGSGDAVSPAP